MLRQLGYVKAAVSIIELWHLITDAGYQKTYAVSHCAVCCQT